jgi:hypothetical protein
MTLFSSWPQYSSWEYPGADQAHCVLFDGNCNYLCDAYLQWGAWRPGRRPPAGGSPGVEIGSGVVVS